jgi:hypothetical protein
MATRLPADPAPIQFAVLADKMIASFFWTTIKAIADDVACVAAALSSVNQATWALLRAHQSNSFRATVGAEQAPFMLSIAGTIGVRYPVLRTACQLDVSNCAYATASALDLAVHASAKH